MSIPHKPLGIIQDMIESIGLDSPYAYDDLIFINHNGFLLQMGERGEDLMVWFNADTPVNDRPEMLAQLQQASTNFSLQISLSGTYTMNQNEGDENIQLQFIEKKS